MFGTRSKVAGLLTAVAPAQAAYQHDVHAPL